MSQEIKPLPSAKKLLQRLSITEEHVPVSHVVETRHRFWGTHLNARAFFTLDSPPGSLLKPLRAKVRWN